MPNDLGWHLRGEVWGDASAALGIINRRGFGKTRHIHTGHLWIQEIVARERLKFKKVLGRDNPADLYTKFLDEKTSLHHTTTLVCRFVGGRAEEAPQLHAMSRSKDDYLYGPNDEVCDWVKEVIHNIEQARHQRQRANNNSSGKEWIYNQCREATNKRVRRQEGSTMQIQAIYPNVSVTGMHNKDNSLAKCQPGELYCNVSVYHYIDNSWLSSYKAWSNWMSQRHGLNIHPWRPGGTQSSSSSSIDNTRMHHCTTHN